MLITNLATLGGQGLATSGSVLPIILIGLIWGFVLKSINPAAYDNIGHMVNED